MHFVLYITWEVDKSNKYVRWVWQTNGGGRTYNHVQSLSAKLRYLARAILQAMPLLIQLLDEITKENLHVQAARTYIEYEYIYTALFFCLSYMSNHVNFPLLQCVSQADLQTGQEKLCEILPRHHDDPSLNNVSTLSQFVVQRHYPVRAPQGELEKIIITRLCQNSARKLKLQCGRDYFPENELPPWATRVLSLTAEQKEGLPVDNLIVELERGFSSFDRRSRIAKCGNRKFTGANIRNNMTMLHA